jgi:uncharacterized protein
VNGLESKETGQSVLKQKLTEDLKQSMKSGNKEKLAVVRMLLSAVKYAEMARLESLMNAEKAKHPQLFTPEKEIQSDNLSPEKAAEMERIRAEKTAQLNLLHDELADKAQLTDADILGVIQKEIRQHQESIESFKKGKRPDLVTQEETEMAIIQAYLPAQAGREEILAAARRIIAETGAQGQRDKGKVMPKLVAEFKGKADGRVINEVVTELLTQG